MCYYNGYEPDNEDLPHLSYPRGGLFRSQEDALDKLPDRCEELEQSVKTLKKSVKTLEERVKSLEAKLTALSRSSLEAYMALLKYIGVSIDLTEENKNG